MDFNVITASGIYLLMQTQDGRVLQVWPVPLDSRPTDGQPPTLRSTGEHAQGCLDRHIA